MGQKVTSCDCTHREVKVNLDGYVELPEVTREDVNQIYKCFEYFGPKDGILKHENLSELRATLPLYMEDIIDDLLVSGSDLTFNDFFFLMKPKFFELKAQNKGFVQMENNSTTVSCIICPYK